MKQYKVNSLADLPKVAEQFMTDFSEHRLFALIGEMGAGKTTFVKAICDYLGVEDAVSSPTFSIVNEYTTAENDTLFHFDFYRLNDEQEALDFGVEEYFDSGEFCFMEWTEKIPSLLPEESVEVKIEEIDGGVRLITVG
ncbi:MAG: tRNA (adenosine(37)-N6)-threonylcarbamoyltransferase complex ATPase subunit type 1 TsaE [Flavobacteriaceae bacterium]|nr:tRNA (adenosine(37)-N6)-threonylcarbamoyltransferase complex ATPase subunit type 1 TsaE [Flavobacteriaceae bacterium]